MGFLSLCVSESPHDIALSNNRHDFIRACWRASLFPSKVCVFRGPIRVHVFNSLWKIQAWIHLYLHIHLTQDMVQSSKISPTYPWKVPRMFHQQFMKEFFLLGVWGSLGAHLPRFHLSLLSGTTKRAEFTSRSSTTSPYESHITMNGLLHHWMITMPMNSSDTTGRTALQTYFSVPSQATQLWEKNNVRNWALLMISGTIF